jgi:ABC-2 type transport system ATP-binding protein
VLLHESSVSDMENLRKVCLHIKSNDITGAKNILEKKGYISILNDEGTLELKDEESVKCPEKISALLVNSGFPPSLVKVEEEDLESFFLRVIKMKGVKQ